MSDSLSLGRASGAYTGRAYTWSSVHVYVVERPSEDSGLLCTPPSAETERASQACYCSTVTRGWLGRGGRRYMVTFPAHEHTDYRIIIYNKRAEWDALTYYLTSLDSILYGH